MSRSWGIELRRGVGVWAAVPLTAAGVAVALAHPRDWAGDWYGWAYYLRTMLIVVGPLVVSVAAWQGGRERRRDLVELLDSTSRSPLRRSLASAASPAAWSAVAFLLVAAAMGAVTASHATYGRPPLLLATSAVAAVVMFAALGFVAGRLLRWRLSAPLLAVATYVAVGAGTYSSGPGSYLSPGVQLFSSDKPAVWWAPATAAVFLALAVAALLLLGPRSRWLSPLALAVAVLAAMPVARAGEDAFAVDPAAEALVCADGSPQVCLTQRHAGQLPEVARTVQQVLAGLDVPGPINEQRFADAHLREPGTLNTLYLGADLRGRADLDVVRQDAAQLAVSWRCDNGPYPSDDELSIATFELTTWVRDRPAPRTTVSWPAAASRRHSRWSRPSPPRRAAATRRPSERCWPPAHEAGGPVRPQPRRALGHAGPDRLVRRGSLGRALARHAGQPGRDHGTATRDGLARRRRRRGAGGDTAQQRRRGRADHSSPLGGVAGRARGRGGGGGRRARGTGPAGSRLRSVVAAAQHRRPARTRPAHSGSRRSTTGLGAPAVVRRRGLPVRRHPGHRRAGGLGLRHAACRQFGGDRQRLAAAGRRDRRLGPDSTPTHALTRHSP